MKRKFLIIGAVVVVLAGIGFYSRHWVSDWWYESNRPKLPAATPFQEIKAEKDKLNVAPPSPIEGGTATSEHFVLESSPQDTTPPQDPLTLAIQLPAQINLAVPWMSQAPDSNWDMPYQEACEEASMLMVDGFYRKMTGRFPVDEADAAIKKLVEYENKTRGDYKDTTAKETADILKGYFGYKDVRVLPFKTSDDIKGIVGRGYPVIIPFSGKELKNPNFRNGGPLYHMLVIKGYTEDGLFITGDPGTRKGEDYTYPYQRIIEAAHDWNGGNVEDGAKVMIVVLPNP